MDNDSLKKRGKIFKNSEIILKPNSKLLLYTDGFIECQPFNNHELSFEEKVREIIDKIKHEKPDAFIQNIYKNLLNSADVNLLKMMSALYAWISCKIY
jgi:hypothetical protein